MTEPLSDDFPAPDIDDDVADLAAMPAAITEPVDLTVEARAHGWRLDHYLARLFPNHSRVQMQRAIEGGHVRLNGLTARQSRRLRVNDRISMELPAAEDGTIEAEDIPIDVLYEDDLIVVVNKSANRVVHPGRGNMQGTLAAALQFHFDGLSDVAGRHRPGIVHRLDRDTSGVILIAKNNQVHQKISRQFAQREVQKEYRAIVRGVPEFQSDEIRTFVSVHPRSREKMTVCPEGGNAREAVTFYRTAESFGRYALMELSPRTGRTHQLRVHMQHIGTPIVADRLYTGQSALTTRDVEGEDLGVRRGSDTGRVLIARQALHAFRLTIQHPVSGKAMTFEAPFPEDIRNTLEFLRSSGIRQ